MAKAIPATKSRSRAGTMTGVVSKVAVQRDRRVGKAERESAADDSFIDFDLDLRECDAARTPR